MTLYEKRKMLKDLLKGKRSVKDLASESGYIFIQKGDTYRCVTEPFQGEIFNEDEFRQFKPSATFIVIPDNGRR